MYTIPSAIYTFAMSVPTFPGFGLQIPLIDSSSPAPRPYMTLPCIQFLLQYTWFAMYVDTSNFLCNLGVCNHTSFSRRYELRARAHAQVLDVWLTERDNRSSRKECLRLRLQNIFSLANKVVLAESLYPQVMRSLWKLLTLRGASLANLA